MKKYIITSIIALSFITCKAQNIVPFDGQETIFIPNSGDYYKDTNNFFNLFEGEWKWENPLTNSSITIIFKKEVNMETSLGFHTDLLVGEYQYIENGQELANTLIDINQTLGVLHRISGVGIITKYNRPQCDECAEDERRLKVEIQHQNYPGVEGKLLLRYINENGVEKIEMLVSDGPALSLDNDAPTNIDIPFGEYVLIKQ